MNIVFWMDPPEFINVKKDTSYALIHECIARKHTVFYASKTAFSIQDNQLNCLAYKCKPFAFGEPIQINNEPNNLTDADIDACWIRCDPPFDIDYLNHMWMLHQFSSTIHFMNSPSGILSTNEKMVIHQFPSIIPQTLVTKSVTDIHQFASNFQSIILKPLDGYGGSGIFKIKTDDTNIDSAIELLSSNGKQFIIAQEALDHTKGDKRILLLDGKPLGAVLRKSDISHRNNFMAGGMPFKTDITDSDKAIIHELQPYLTNNHLPFVGIDIIDNKLTEINVTSPTCLQEMNQLYNVTLQGDIIDDMESKIA